jgi:alpha-1,6-mannosyltransferase
VIVALLIGLTLHRLPWRYVPGTGERYSGEDLDPAALDAPPGRPPAARHSPDAYAESP